MGFVHIRVPNAPEDFALLSPTNPMEDLGDYTCFESKLHWLYCKNCAVRCFTFMGKGEVIEKEIDGEKKSIWAPKAEGWVEGEGHSYLSVNAQTLDAKQEGLDMREWVEKKWIHYLEWLDDSGGDRLGEPHPGGTY